MRMWSRAGGKHPPLNANMKHLWAHDEVAAADGLKDVVGNRDLSTVGGTPACVDGPINFRARRLVRASSNFFRSTSSDPTDASTLQTCTVGGCFRLTTAFANDGYMLLLGDNGALFVIAIAVTAARQIRLIYHDNGSVFRSYDFSPVLQLGKWYPWYVIRNNGGTSSLFLDGGLVETLTTAVPCAASATAKWHVGCDIGPGFGNRIDADIASIAVYTGAESSTSIEDAMAGMRMLNYPTSLYVTAEVKDADGTYRDFSNLRRQDFLRSVQIDDDVDANMSSAVIECVRDRGDQHLGRFNDNVLNRTPFSAAPASTSYSATRELLQETRRIRIKVDRRALDSGFAQDSVAAGLPNWNVRFDGSIDKVRWGGGGNKVNIEAREYIGAMMMRVWMPVTSVRGSSGGTAAETVAQGLIDDAKGDSPPDNYADNWGLTNSTDFDLDTPTSPGWNVRLYQQQPGALLDEINIIFEQIGWIVRPWWKESASAYKLTAMQPDRNQRYPNLVVDDSFIMDQGDMEISVADVRNEIWVTFVPRAGTSLTVGSIPTGDVSAVVGTVYLGPTGTYADATSSAGRTGNRVTFRVRSDNLDSTEEGSDSITVRGVQRAILGESATKNVDTLVEAQSYGVAVLRDLQEPKIARSDRTPGLPEAEINDIIKFRAGQWHSADLQMALTQWSFQADRGGDSSQLGLRGRPSGGTKRHLDKEVGANGTPTPTHDTTQDETQAGMTTRAQRQLHASLLTNNQQYLRASKQMANVRNGDFSVRSFGDAPPDSWTTIAGTWNTDLTVDDAVVEQAVISMKFMTNTGVLESDFIPCRLDHDIRLYWRQRTDSGSGAITQGWDAYWYQADKTASGLTASTSGSLIGFSANNAWETRTQAFRAPADGAYFKLRTKRSGAGSHNTWIQWAETFLVKSNFRAYKSSNQALTDSTINNKVTLPNVSTRSGEFGVNDGLDWSTANSTYTAPYEGWYIFWAQVEMDADSDARGYISIRRGSTNGADGEQLGKSADYIMQSGWGRTSMTVPATTGVIWLQRGDVVTLWAYNSDSDSGSPHPLVLGSADGETTWFCGMNLDCA